jgi:hypothetical protein
VGGIGIELILDIYDAPWFHWVLEGCGKRREPGVQTAASAARTDGNTVPKMAGGDEQRVLLDIYEALLVALGAGTRWEAGGSHPAVEMVRAIERQKMGKKSYKWCQKRVKYYRACLRTLIEQERRPRAGAVEGCGGGCKED